VLANKGGLSPEVFLLSEITSPSHKAATDPSLIKTIFLATKGKLL